MMGFYEEYEKTRQAWLRHNRLKAELLASVQEMDRIIQDDWARLQSMAVRLTPEDRERAYKDQFLSAK